MAYAWKNIFENAAAASGNAITVSAIYAAHDRAQVLLTYGDAAGTLATSVTDGTNTYGFLGKLNIGADSQSFALYECKDCAAGTFTVSFTPGLATDFRGIAVLTQSGLDNTTTGQFVSNQQASPGTGANAVTSTNLAPASQPGIFGAVAVDDNGSASSITAGATFTSEGTLPTWESNLGVITRVEDVRVTATTAKAGTATAVGSGAGNFATFAFFVPEGAGAPAGQPTMRRAGGIKHMNRIIGAEGVGVY